MLKIVHVSDLHVEAKPESMYPGVGRTLRDAVPMLRRERPDLVIVSGDLTSHGSSRRDELVTAKAWLDELRLPYLAIPGNHDLGVNEWRSQESPVAEHYDPSPFGSTNYGVVFGPALVPVYELDGIRVVGVVVRENDPDGAVASLAAELERSDMPTIVVGHYPLAHSRDGGVLGSSGISDIAPHTLGALRELLIRTGHVCMYVFGHIHAATARAIGGGLTQVSAGGLGPGASVYRTYLVDAGLLRVRTRLGPGPLGFWERLCPAGSYPVEYHLGAPEERRFCVSMCRGEDQRGLL